jgi:hypothetical protein
MENPHAIEKKMMAITNESLIIYIDLIQLRLTTNEILKID